MLPTVTGNSDYLRRGRAFCDFMLRTWRPDLGLATKAGYYPEKVEYLEGKNAYSGIHNASAIPFWHLYKITGEGQYLPSDVLPQFHAPNPQAGQGQFAVKIHLAEADQSRFPIGAQGTAAIYTGGGGFAVLRRISIRAHSWLNWLYPMNF